MLIRSVPVPFIASTALSIRFVHTWFSSPAYASIRGTSAPYDRITSIPPRSLCPSMTSVLSIPSVTSIVWIEPRSICEYERTAATSSVMRRVDSFTSPSNVAAESVLATHSSPGSSESPSTSAARIAPLDAGSGGGQWRCDHPVLLDAVLVQPLRDRVLVVGEVDRIRCRGAGTELEPQFVEGAELGGRHLARPRAAAKPTAAKRRPCREH